MPGRDDIKKILVIGPGPIVIGQAGELDAQGALACQALLEEGYELVVVSPTPGALMTQPKPGCTVYMEPIHTDTIRQILQKEKPGGLLAQFGGQTAQNIASALHLEGVLEECGTSMLGLTPETIAIVEDGVRFQEAMKEAGIATPDTRLASDLTEAMELSNGMGLPAVLRPMFASGHTVTVYNRQELEPALRNAFHRSPIDKVRIEQSLAGWKTLAFIALRDQAGAFLALTSLESLHAVGVTWGDAPIVAPSMSFDAAMHDKAMEQAAKVMEQTAIVGAAKVHFAINPETDDIRIIDVSPCLSRVSAFAAKASGLPLARVTAKLSVGYTMAEAVKDLKEDCRILVQPGDETIAIRLPRFSYEKFPVADRQLNTTMKSDGEAIGIGSCFCEALQNAFRALDNGAVGLGFDGKTASEEVDLEKIRESLVHPDDRFLLTTLLAIGQGMELEEIHRLSHVALVFLKEIQRIADTAKAINALEGKDALTSASQEDWKQWKACGFADAQIAFLTGAQEAVVRDIRTKAGVKPVFGVLGRGLDAGENQALFGHYGAVDSSPAPSEKKKVVLLSAGPSRIGQGVESDTNLVQASTALRKLGYDTIVICSNPASVTADPQWATQVYFGSLTTEDVLEIFDQEKPGGFIVQFGGRTARHLSRVLSHAGYTIFDTDSDAQDRVLDRTRLKGLVAKLGYRQPEGGAAYSRGDALALATRIGYPVVCRRYYPEGGRAMSILFTTEELERFLDRIMEPAGNGTGVLIDKFLDYANEASVDAICDGESVYIAGILEHIEEAGVHMIDSAVVLPPHTLPGRVMDQLKEQTRAIAMEAGLKGLFNIQFAIKGSAVYILGVSPRASHTIPMVSHSSGIPLAAVAAEVLMGKTLAELDLTGEADLEKVSVMEAVFPFARFPGVDPVLGPEMRATGHVMGIYKTYGMAFLKSQQAAGQMLPTSGNVFFSLKDDDKKAMIPVAKKFVELGFHILATSGTADVFARNQIPHEIILKVSEGRPNVVDRIINGEVCLLINTPSGHTPTADEISIRRKSYAYDVPLVTTVSGAFATADGIAAMQKGAAGVCSLKEHLG